MESQTAELERASPDSPAGRRSEPGNVQTVKPPARLSNPKVRLALIGAAIGLLLIVVIAYLHYHNRISTDDAEVDGHIMPMSARISGTVAEVLVHDNQMVKAGDVLVRLDPRDYQAKADQAKAALQAAQSNAAAATVGVPITNETTLSATHDAGAALSVAQANYNRARLTYEQASTAQLAAAQAQVERAQADDEKARADLERMKPLAAKAEISQQELDSYTAAAKVTASELQQAQQNLTATRQSAEIAQSSVLAAQAQVEQAQAIIHEANANRKQVDVRTADVHSADAAIAQARANYEAATLNLSYTTITAPADGAVTRKSVEVGQVLQPGQGLLVLVPLSNVWVTANFKETQLANVHPGDRAEVHVDMYGSSFTGHVDSIAGATGSRLSLLPPENATGNFVKVVQRIPVKIILDPIPPEKAVLRPGMNVDATIFTE
jgi:membrane fusion protein (multidrug efflux system)